MQRKVAMSAERGDHECREGDHECRQGCRGDHDSAEDNIPKLSCQAITLFDLTLS